MHVCFLPDSNHFHKYPLQSAKINKVREQRKELERNYHKHKQPIILNIQECVKKQFLILYVIILALFNNNMCRYEHVRVCLVPYSDRKA